MSSDRVPALIHVGDDGLALADNGLAYRIRSNPRECMCECFAYRTADMFGLPTPRFDILYDPETEQHVLGVTWQQAEALSGIDTLHELISGEAGRSFGGDALASLLVLDLWLLNDDRHCGNLLIQRSPMGMQLLAIDFARARPYIIRDQPEIMLDDRCNSVRFYRAVYRERGDLPMAPVQRMMSRIEVFMADRWIPAFIDAAPVEWQQAVGASSRCLAFWEEGRRKRLAAMRDWLDAFVVDLGVAA